MSTFLHPDPDDLVLYSMNSLDSAQTAKMHAHLEQCAACAADVADCQRDLALLALSTPLSAPPPEARQRLLDAAAAENAAARNTASFPTSVAAPTSPRTSAPEKNIVDFPTPQRKPVATWLAWAAAAACLFYAVHLRQQNQALHQVLQVETAQMLQLGVSSARAQDVLDVLTSPQAKRVSLVTSAVKPQPSGHAVYLKERGALFFTASNLAPLPLHKTYELWVIPANGSAPIPAGTFAPDSAGYASVVLPKLPVGVAAKAFGVTMENAGGALTPTMPILMAGA